MARSFTITAEDASKRSIIVQRVDGLRIIKTLYHPGYWLVTDYPVATPANDMASRHFLTAGEFTEPTNTLTERKAGYRSWEDSAIIPAGAWRRESASGCEMWCIWNDADLEGRVDHVTMVYLTAGQEYTVPDQSNLFSACGVLSLNGRDLEDEKPYVLRSGARTVTAVQDAYFLHWPVSAP